MTQDETIKDFEEMFKDKIPNLDHFPKLLEYQIKLYKHMKSRETHHVEKT